MLSSLSVQTHEQECNSVSLLKLSRGKCGSGHCLALGLPVFFGVQAVQKGKSKPSTLKNEKPALLGGSKLPKPVLC